MVLRNALEGLNEEDTQLEVLAAIEDLLLETEGAPQGQVLDAGNTTAVTSADASPGTPWTGSWTETRDADFVRVLTILAASDPTISGTFTFEFSETGTEALGSAPITESRPIGDFDTVRDFDLLNAGAYYRVAFEPDGPLGAESVFVTTTLRKQDDGAFVRLANQEIEEANAALASSFAYGKAFDELTGKSVNLRPTFSQRDPVNELATSLGADEVWTGEWRNVQQHGSLIFLYAVGALTGSPIEVPASVVVEFSDDQLTVSGTSALTEELVESGPFTFSVWLLISNGTYGGKYARPVVTNTSTPQTVTPISIFARNQHPFNGTFDGLEASLSPFSRSLLVRAVAAGVTPDNEFKNIRVGGTSAAMSSETLLTAGEVFASPVTAIDGFVQALMSIRSDQPGTAVFRMANDDAMLDVVGVVTFAYEPADPRSSSVILRGNYATLEYTNGPIGQNDFALHTQLDTVSLGGHVSTLDEPVEDLLLAQLTKGAVLAPDDGGDWGTVTRSGSNLRVAVGEHEVETPIKPGRSLIVGQRPLSATTPTRLFASVAVDRLTLSVKNLAADANVAYGPTDQVSMLNGDVLDPRERIELDLYEGQELWGITDATAAETSGVRSGSATSTVGSPTDPNNVLATDDSRASLTASGQAVGVTGFSGVSSPGFPSFVSVEIGVEIAKQAGQTATATHNAVAAGGTSSGTSVTTPSITPTDGDLQLLCVSWRSDETILSVVGMGLTWVEVGTAIGQSEHTNTSMWRGTGTPTAGAVTVNFSGSSTNAVATVESVSGVDLSSPINDVDVVPSTSLSDTYSASVAGLDKGLVVSAVGMRQRTHTPGSGFTEQLEARTGTGNNDASIAVNTLGLSVDGAQAVTGTLSGNVGWSLIAVSLTPAAAADPTFTLSYEYSGTPGATDSGTLTASDTSDSATEVDVTDDRAWITADLANIEPIVTADLVGAANLEIDHVYIRVREGEEEGITRISTAQVGAS